MYMQVDKQGHWSKMQKSFQFLVIYEVRYIYLLNKTSKKEEKSRVKKVLRSQLLFLLFLFCLFFLFTKFAKVRVFFHLFCLIFSNSVKKNLANSANILRFVSLCHLRLKWSHLTLTFSFLSIWFLSFAESRPIVGPNFVQIQER